MSDPTQWIYTNTDYPQIKPGDNERVYRNLHRKCWSVQARVDGKWRVVGWADRIIIRHGKFRTSKAGADRVRRERCKNVHAWCEGVWSNTWPKGLSDRWLRVSYNPYKSYDFVNDSGATMKSAPTVAFSATGSAWFPYVAA